jgi:hypothetical protein
VLEFRSGSSALAGVDDRLAGLLGKATSLVIVDADAARRSYGANLDRDLVACAGAASCVARIGQKLGVREVLLVGVSEFGDVILTCSGSGAPRSRAQPHRRGARAGQRPTTGHGRYLKRLMPSSASALGVIGSTPTSMAPMTIDRMPRGARRWSRSSCGAGGYRIRVVTRLRHFSASGGCPEGSTVEPGWPDARTRPGTSAGGWRPAGTVLVGGTTAVMATRPRTRPSRAPLSV